MVLKNCSKKIAAVLCAFVFSFSSAASLFAMQVPELSGRVNDYANIISADTEEEITQYLEDLENTTGIQMAVLTVKDLQGESIEAFSIKVCEKWQLGQKEKDNGALLLVDMGERSVRIEVGYGLEDKLTDAKCGLIIRNVIIPEFKNGFYSSGIKLGIQNMGGIASDNAKLVSYKVSEESDSDSGSAFCIIFTVIWMLFIFFIIISSTGIIPGLYLFSSGSHRRDFFSPGPPPPHSGGFSGGSFSGGFSHSGGFGSGFSGGGGHFGGGGASGHF